MNEKLKEAVLAWFDDPIYSEKWIVDLTDANLTMSQQQARSYALLAAAARGEIPGNLLVSTTAPQHIPQEQWDMFIAAAKEASNE